MRVDFNFFQPNNTLSHVGQVNRGQHRNGVAASVLAGGRPNRDRVTLSPQGKMMQQVDALMKQKETILESRKTLVSRVKESGGDMDTIKEQLDVYTQQLEDLDKQVAELYAQQAKEMLEKAQEKKAKESEPSDDKTQEELDTEKLSTLASMSDNLRQTETVTSVENKIKGEVRVQVAEAELDGLRLELIKDKAKDGANVKEMVGNLQRLLNDKKGNIATLEAKAQELSLKQGISLQAATAKLEATATAEASKEEEQNPDQEGPEAAQ